MKKLLGIVVLGLILSSTAIANQLSKSPFIPDDVYNEFNKLPKDHPITFELYDVRGTLKEKRVVLDNVNKVYALHTATSLEDPTGNWRAIVKVGGASFSKNLKIETVKPNRLKINMDFGKEKFTTADAKLKGDLQVNWLHGAPASNLTTKVEMHLTSASTYFKKFKDFRSKFVVLEQGFWDMKQRKEIRPTMYQFLKLINFY